jgi:hypothetical protein
LFRDKLAAEKNVLCFDIGTAGVANHFPCLVILGICNYSDSHNYRQWQRFAAMAAVAYTKDLLYRISPIKIDSKTRIGNILSDQFEEASVTSATGFSRYEGPLVLAASTPLFIRYNHVFKDESL